METKRANWVMAVLVCVLMMGFGAIFAESLYVVSHSSDVFSFDVVNGELDPRAQVSLTGNGYGGIDLAIDNDHDILFMSSENTNIFQILDAKELTLIKSFTFTGTGDITGIVYDEANSRLLGTQRNTNDLYIFSWEPAIQKLTLDETIQLSNITYACDLAINGDTLYVSEYRYSIGGTPPTYKDIYAYDMSDDFSFIEKIGMGDYVVSIDYNATDDSVYAGAFLGHENIIKRTFDPNALVDGDIGAKVTGIATNSDVAGRVFITSYHNNGSVEWWDVSETDPNDWILVDDYTYTDNNQLYGLAGLVVGDNYIEPRIDLTKSHDANDCVSPGDTFKYTISWHNDTDETATDVTLVDYLPEGVDYDYIISIIPPVFDANYFDNGHYYKWELDDIGPDESGYVELKVTVNEMAEPGMWLDNKAVMTSSLGNTVVDINEPNICCWDSGTILYIDETATGNNNGASWADAYTDLQRALKRATYTTCVPGPNTVYVAQGTYNPGYDPEASFVLLDGMSMYGGFKSGGDTFTNRDPKKHKTILTGDNGSMSNEIIVIMADETILDGFIVTASTDYGIYGDGVDFKVENCRIESNGYGIRAKDGNTTVKWCNIALNEEDGIYHSGGGYELTIENSWIMRNRRYGIFCTNSTPTILNSIVSESDLAEEGREGIRMVNPASSPKLFNITIANNKAKGVFFVDNQDSTGDPNDKDWPDMQNCIVYYNNSGGDQLAGIKADDVAYYCCIQDCNEVNSNINDEPEFAYTVDPAGAPDPNNYHLAYDSYCKDKGSPLLTYTDQVDIDGEGTHRKYGTYVDIGADEIYSCDEPLTEENISNDLDWNADGVVNLHEFSKFSAAWLSHDPNDPAWIADPNLADPNLSEGWYEWKYICNLDATGNSQYEIDLADLEVFVSDTPWLWEACWRDNYLAAYGMMSGGGESMMTAIPMMSAMSFESTAIEPLEEEKTYADMPNSELVPLVVGIYEIIDHLEICIEEDHENAENLTEAKDFLEDILSDIEASRQ